MSGYVISMLTALKSSSFLLQQASIWRTICKVLYGSSKFGAVWPAR